MTILIGALLMGAIAMGTGCSPSGESSRGGVRALADEFLDAYLDRYPEIATYYGVPGKRHDRLTDNSPAARSDWEAREDAWLARIRELQPTIAVGDPDWAVFGILRETLEAAVESRVCRTELWRVSETDGWQTFLSYIALIQPVGSDDLRAQALARARALPSFLETQVANLREGLRRGYSAPQGNVRLVIEEMRGLLKPDAPLGSPGRRDTGPEFQATFREVVEKEINPAVEKYMNFLQEEYLPAARETIAVAANPEGGDCYRAAIRAHSTLRMPPREIHDLGLREMAKIEEEMGMVAERSFGTSDVPALLQRLTTERQYAFDSRDEIIEYAHAAVARAREAMPRWFGRLPRADFRIEPYPAFRERSGTGEYQTPSEDGSRPGVFYIPTRDPEHRPRAGQESLAFHETIPGHHLQGAIALELGDRGHPISRYLYSSGYAEGWALYSERLADEMNLYGTDLDRMGMLSDQAGRAARLVIDSGIHEFGWTRQQSIEYMATHTTWATADVEAEIDRYIIWPGQATAYMLGMLEIQRLRRRVEEELGSAFRIQDFHDRILEDGSVSLGMLEEKIEHWIDRERSARGERNAGRAGGSSP